jgi:fatty-acyl-CoA synthase
MAIAKLADIEAIERTPFQERESAQSVYALLARTADRHADKIAIRYLPTGAPDDPVRDVTYRELKQRIHQSANLFRRLGVQPDEAVSMLLPILPETFFAMFGAQIAGVANPINFLLEIDHIVALLREANCRVLLGPDPELFPGVWPKIEAVRKAVPSLTAVVRVGGVPSRADIDALHFETELDRQPGDALDFEREIGPESVASLFHTGGTTSAPKLARHTHRGLIMHSWALANVLLPGAEQVFFNGLPPFHVGGSTVLGLMPLAGGATMVMLSPAGYRNPRIVNNIWAHVARFRPTVFGMVPTSWGAALNVPSEGFDVSSIRLCQVGGSAMPVEIAKAVQAKLKAPVVEGWGMTEVHGYASMNPVDGECRIGSVGFRTPYTEIVVAELANGRIRRLCAADEIGSVLVRGHQVFAGYVSPAHNAKVWIEPMVDEVATLWSPGGRWLDTGDLGRFDADKYLWLTGRAKDLIIRGGHNIDPLPIEEAVHRHPAIESAAAVGRPDSYAGEIPVLFVQLKSGAVADAEEIKAFAREHVTERAAGPAEVIILDQMPLTGVGKIFKPELRYHAARLVFERLVGSLVGDPARVTVEVGPHRQHGTFATIKVRGALSEATQNSIRDALRGFQLRHEIRIES